MAKRIIRSIVQFIKVLDRGLETCADWILDRFNCKECKVLRDQVSLLENDNKVYKELWERSELERVDLQSQLLSLLNPQSSVRVPQERVGGYRTWRSFVGDRKRKIEKAKSIPDSSISEYTTYEDTPIIVNE